jgi:hypothetical protein
MGVALMGASILAAVLVQLPSGSVLDTRTVREDKLPSGAVASVIVVDFHLRYGIPLAAGFAVGLGCLAWPPRRPPRIAS